jgi:hypothetical protein
LVCLKVLVSLDSVSDNVVESALDQGGGGDVTSGDCSEVHDVDFAYTELFPIQERSL